MIYKGENKTTEDIKNICSLFDLFTISFGFFFFFLIIFAYSYRDI